MNFDTAAFLLTHALVRSAKNQQYKYYFTQQFLRDGTDDVFVGEFTDDLDRFYPTLDAYHQWRKDRAEKCNKVTWDIALWQSFCREHCSLTLFVDLDVRSFYLGLQRFAGELPLSPLYIPSGFDGGIEEFKTYARKEKRLVELLFCLRAENQTNKQIIVEIQKLAASE